jgi:hypothetical protein
VHTDSDLERDIISARARVRYRFPWWLRPLLMRGVVAITLGRWIYVAADATLPIRFVRHELAHVRQINRLGLIRFYWRYVCEYLSNRRGGMSAADAYRNISFEIEAQAAEDTV